MRESKKLRNALLMALAAAAIAGCQANGGGTGGAGSGGAPTEDNGPDGIAGTEDDNGGFGPNDGSTGTTVFVDTDDDGVADTLVEEGKGFVCTNTTAGATTEVGADGLVGAAVGPLLGLLGGGSIDTLLDSVTSANDAIDANLGSAAVFTTTLGGLAGLLTSVELNVLLPGAQSGYAVYGLSFPGGTLDLSLMDEISIVTYLDDVEQESAPLSNVAIDLLGTNVSANEPVFFGLQATKPFDRVALSVASQLLSVNLGEQLHAHELCVGGTFFDPPDATPTPEPTATPEATPEPA